MNFLKKWLNSITLFICGFLGLILSLCSGMKTTYSIDATALGAPYADAISKSHSETTKAYKVLTDGNLKTTAESLGVGSEFGIMKAFGVIGVIVSILLIIWAIVSVLQNLNIININGKIFNIITIIMPIAFLVATAGLLSTSLIYAKAQQDALLKMVGGQLTANPAISNYISLIKIDASVVVGLYQPLILAVSIISLLLIGAFSFLKSKKA